jgi:hypothetical protein
MAGTVAKRAAAAAIADFMTVLEQAPAALGNRQEPACGDHTLEPRARSCDLPRMSEESPVTLPDRLSVNPNSPFYDEAVLARNVGVRFKGQDKTNVEEYCVSEGWVRLSVGASRDRHGNPLTVKLQGPVEPYFREG